MSDEERLKYDLAMHSAVVMTLQSFQKGRGGNAERNARRKFERLN